MKPVHPILVHFPLALLPVSVAAEVVGFFAGISSLSATGWWTMLAAGVAGFATAGAGLFDMYRAPLSEEVHGRVHRHMRFGLVLAAAIAGLATWRGLLFARGQIVPLAYLDLAALTVALALFQGWLGGELVYGDGVFVQAGDGEASGHKHDTAKAAKAAKTAKAGKAHHH